MIHPTPIHDQRHLLLQIYQMLVQIQSEIGVDGWSIGLSEFHLYTPDAVFPDCAVMHIIYLQTYQIPLYPHVVTCPQRIAWAFMHHQIMKTSPVQTVHLEILPSDVP